MQGRRRFGRRDEHGQVIPIVALLVVIITGFAAISLDAGMDYAQSRNDNDISDAAALAGTYTFFFFFFFFQLPSSNHQVTRDRL